MSIVPHGGMLHNSRPGALSVLRCPRCNKFSLVLTKQVLSLLALAVVTFPKRLPQIRRKGIQHEYEERVCRSMCKRLRHLVCRHGRRSPRTNEPRGRHIQPGTKRKVGEAKEVVARDTKKKKAFQNSPKGANFKLVDSVTWSPSSSLSLSYPFSHLPLSPVLRGLRRETDSDSPLVLPVTLRTNQHRKKRKKTETTSQRHSC